jgi:NAD(P)-dependent dehydrogenase (short-subunit alcohol dehydrogenase family)
MARLELGHPHVPHSNATCWFSENGGATNPPKKGELIRKLFGLDVWSYAAVTQAFLPLPVVSKGGMPVDQTSITSVAPFLFSGPSKASKAATSMLSGVMRLEFVPFDAQAVDLKTGTVGSRLVDGLAAWKLPRDSLYEPAVRSREGCDCDRDGEVRYRCSLVGGEGSERFVEEETTRQILEWWVGNSSLVHDGFQELDTQWTEHRGRS